MSCDFWLEQEEGGWSGSIACSISMQTMQPGVTVLNCVKPNTNV